MTDEWDDYEQQLKSEKIETRREHHDPNPDIIAGELKAWWTGINDKTINLIPGLPLLETYIPKYIPGHLIVVSGYTSAGKSQLLSQIIKWTADDQNTDTLVFSLEDSRMEKLISLVSIVSEDVYKKRMLLGDISGIEEKLDVILKSISCWPLKIYDDVYRIVEMEGLIIKHKPKIVILDYVQNTIGQGSLYERMSMASSYLFRIAQENNITFFVVSQIDNESARNESEGFIALKGGGDLSAAAHTVIHLKKGREDKNRSEVDILIKKNKGFGPCGKYDAQFNNRWTLIEPRDPWKVC
jgi:replicative DNA helicase